MKPKIEISRALDRLRIAHQELTASAEEMEIAATDTAIVSQERWDALFQRQAKLTVAHRRAIDALEKAVSKLNKALAAIR